MSSTEARRRIAGQTLADKGYESELVVELFEPRWWRLAKWSLTEYWMRDKPTFDKAHVAIAIRLEEGRMLRRRRSPYLRLQQQNKASDGG